MVIAYTTLFVFFLYIILLFLLSYLYIYFPFIVVSFKSETSSLIPDIPST